jgi:hypothetical protein
VASVDISSEHQTTTPGVASVDISSEHQTTSSAAGSPSDDSDDDGDDDGDDDDGGDDDDDDDNDDDGGDDDDDDDDDDDEPYVVVKHDVSALLFESLGLPKYPYTCDHGEHCSDFVDCVLFGPIAFDHCIVKQCHPNSVNIIQLQHQYQFAIFPPPVGAITNSYRRKLLYYYYYITYFRLVPQGRKELPPCLVAAIRARFPNPCGTEYMGFKNS